MTSTAPRQCPICHQSMAADATQFLPFCSLRCRQIDLGRWLGERYRLPVERREDPSPNDCSESSE